MRSNPMEEEACEAPPRGRALLTWRTGAPAPVDPVLSFAPRGSEHAGVTPATSASYPNARPAGPAGLAGLADPDSCPSPLWHTKAPPATGELPEQDMPLASRTPD